MYHTLTSKFLPKGKEYWNGVEHPFNLNFNLFNPEVEGIIGIEQTYISAIKNNKFALSGPTLFQPILQKAKSIANISNIADQNPPPSGQFPKFSRGGVLA